jgi:hypothetical protein
MELQYFKKKQLERYGQQAIDYFNDSKQLEKYIARIAVASPVTARAYRGKIYVFLNCLHRSRLKVEFRFYPDQDSERPN